MKYHGYKILLILLRVFVYIKRGLVWSWGYIVKWMTFLRALYAKSLGFYLYKIWFLVIRKLGKYKIPFDSRFVDIIGKRGTLQVLLFFILVFVMYPQSKLYSQDIGYFPGRQTLLYRLVGPGDQLFLEEDITIEQANFDISTDANGPAWKEGAVAIDTPVSSGIDMAPEVADISAVTAGGSALTKPSILSGSTLPTTDSAADSVVARRDVQKYTVQSGDVIGAIAEKFGVSLNTILWANNLTMRSYIRPGDELTILPASGVIHTVKNGDTVTRIARLYDATQDDIVEANRLQKDGGDIVVGEELFVPGGKKPQPVKAVTSRPSGFSGIAAPPPSVTAPAGSGYLWPAAVSRITQYFGLHHAGLDIAGPIGTSVYASRSGRVIKSQCGYNGGYGCYIIIDHGAGIQTLYGHASQLYVGVGEQVTQGETIMAMGSTGRSTGSHVHFEVRVNGRVQNPLQYTR